MPVIEYDQRIWTKVSCLVWACAHCGADPVTIIQSEIVKDGPRVYIQCSGCGLRTKGHAEARDAIDAWQMRSPGQKEGTNA